MITITIATKRMVLAKINSFWILNHSIQMIYIILIIILVIITCETNDISKVDRENNLILEYCRDEIAKLNDVADLHIFIGCQLRLVLIKNKFY